MTSALNPRHDSSRHQLKFEWWPKLDQLAWKACTALGDILEPGAPASRWTQTTQRNVCKAYGRWLTWLIDNGMLDSATAPEQRVTPESVAGYVAKLRTQILSTTVFSYIELLALAVSAMAPEVKWEWLWDIVGRLKSVAVPSNRKCGRIVPARNLVAFGLRLMNDADEAYGLPASKRALAFRNGLMIALLAARPFRLRNFTSIEIGNHLFKQGSAYYLRFKSAELKTRRTRQDIEVPFPVGLVCYLVRYLDVYRPVLLAQTQVTASTEPAERVVAGLWISSEGCRMAETSVHARIVELTAAEFGKPINPHLFRDCAATSIAEEDPEHARIIMTILGHTNLATSDRHYNQATSAKASSGYQLQLLAMRAQGAKLARQAHQRRSSSKG